VAQRIDLRIGPGLNTLRSLLAEHGAGSFDFAFIDADKPAYDAYYEACLQLVRPGGVITLDNMLRHGEVVDTDTQDAGAKALKALNEKIRDDSRVRSVLLTIGDGVTVVRKR
jgi:caffeoyl-CoA O-methyltransferase